MHFTVQYFTVLYCTVLYCTIFLDIPTRDYRCVRSQEYAAGHFLHSRIKEIKQYKVLLYVKD